MPVLFLLIASAAVLLAEDAAGIMFKVAQNQDRAESLRSTYLYHQRIVKSVRHTNGRTEREDVREFDVFPGPRGAERKLVSRSGDGPVNVEIRMETNGATNVDFSAAMIEDDSARDGLGTRLSLLTTKEQARYVFQLAGRKKLGDREVYRIRFQPRDESACWAGEAWIDAAEFQPVRVSTHLARRAIPLAIRIFLGTNVSGMHFDLAYRKFEDGVWFPESYDGEFKLSVFFAKRLVFLSLRNSGFRKTDVTSDIAFEER